MGRLRVRHVREGSTNQITHRISWQRLRSRLKHRDVGALFGRFRKSKTQVLLD